METLLEQQRRYHEERERLVDAMVKEKQHQCKTHREQINSSHRLRKLLDRYVECSSQLRDLYEDNDGLRKEELAALSGPNEFAEFYTRLKNIRDFHRKHPNEISIPMSAEFAEFDKTREDQTAREDTQTLVDFKDEESYGRYLDLHECYDRFINLKGVEKVDYLSYLASFDQLFDIPRERKNNSYRDYLQSLLSYLGSFLFRTKPLLDIQAELGSVREDFEKDWVEGTFPGWPKEASGALTHSGAHLDLSAFSSWEELASLGLDRLKSALMALGLKCGGTLEERAKRLFSTKGQRLRDLESRLFAKEKGDRQTEKEREQQKQHETAGLEAQVYHLVELLSEQRTATRDNVERRQARTMTERGVGGAGGEESDEERGMSDADDSDEDEDDVPYNPKNLPLGWDNKPIPYWLYKLHGLNMYFNCEICGNCRYRGPKSFQRHFAEWRHAHGMKCLNIPNTAHFANVTQIEDAKALWAKLKAVKDSERWKPEVEEEYEDSAGNVVSKKIFDDLKRQGLL